MERLVRREKIQSMEIKGWKVCKEQSSGVSVERGQRGDLVLMEKTDLEGMLKKLSQVRKGK